MMERNTIHDILDYASSRLSRLDTARLDSEILLCSLLNREREFVYTHPEEEIDETTLADFNSLLAKRADGFPVAYLTGHREFWSIRLQVNRHTLIPRPETEHLVEAALGLTRAGDRLNILDLGTGSGAIAIAMARERPTSQITATDISIEALHTAAENAAFHNLNNIGFLHSDWFSELGARKYDLILCNPPYVKSSDPGFCYGEIRHEPRLALDGGESGMAAYHQIIPQAIRHLNHKGSLIMEHGSGQAAAVAGLLRMHAYSDLQTISDYSGHERICLARYPG